MGAWVVAAALATFLTVLVDVEDERGILVLSLSVGNGGAGGAGAGWLVVVVVAADEGATPDLGNG
ncbi:hypothetical protein RRF57_003779 [Xylaria bambusicola]|uniref:Secreted protein n=1 Tax=Xylaria bambusicola TaxID=326684 RepID=A0AAN7ULF8_9PEZI